jgi:hypothetical protein
MYIEINDFSTESNDKVNNIRVHRAMIILYLDLNQSLKSLRIVSIYEFDPPLRCDEYNIK